MTQLDVTGLNQPMPILKIRRALMQLQTGARLEVTGDDPALVADIPAFCTQAGHQLVMAQQKGRRYIFELICGKAGLTAPADTALMRHTG